MAKFLPDKTTAKLHRNQFFLCKTKHSAKVYDLFVNGHLLETSWSMIFEGKSQSFTRQKQHPNITNWASIGGVSDSFFSFDSSQKNKRKGIVLVRTVSTQTFTIGKAHQFCLQKYWEKCCNKMYPHFRKKVAIKENWLFSAQLMMQLTAEQCSKG